MSLVTRLTKHIIIENWLNAVAYSHSFNPNTRKNYLRYFQQFLDHAETTPEKILADYDDMEEKQFKRHYTPLLFSFLGKQQEKKMSPSSQQNALCAVKSFFKYNSLPLNFIPSGRKIVIFHNRDITKDEIEEIIRISQPREKAYYALIVQSGLRPNEISNLKIEDFENLMDDNTPIPCKITIRQEITKGQYESYFSFAGKESISLIKEYFKRKRKMSLEPEEYVFVMSDGVTKTDTDLISHIFRRTVRKLKKQKVLDFKNKKSENANRNELRLYNLRKYFRNHAGSAGPDFVNFWMGHSLGVDGSYFSKTDFEMHRKQYAEKAMKNLRIDNKTPDENEELMIELRAKLDEKDKEIQELKASVGQITEIKKEMVNQQYHINNLTDLIYKIVDPENKLESLIDQKEEKRLSELTCSEREAEEEKAREAIEMVRRHISKFERLPESEKEKRRKKESMEVQHLNYEDTLDSLVKQIQNLKEIYEKEKKLKTN